MDRNAILGLVLVAVILITFSWLNSPDAEPAAKKDSKSKKDSVKVEKLDTTAVDSVTAEIPVLVIPDSIAGDSVAVDSIKRAYEATQKAKTPAPKGPFANATKGKEEVIALENGKVKVYISTKGATISQIELPEFMSYDTYAGGGSSEENPLLLADSTFNNEFVFNMARETPMTIHTGDLYFVIHEKNDQSVTLRLHSDIEGSYIDVVYHLGKNNYEVGYSVIFHKMGSVVRPKELEYVWEMNGISTEKSLSQQQQIAGVFYQFKGEGRDYLSEMEDDSEPLETKLDWIAYKQSYFSAVLINDDGILEEGGKMSHEIYEKGIYLKKFKTRFENIAIEDTDTDSLSFTWYFGPNEFESLAAYDNGMHNIINYGPSIFGWLNRNFFQPVFNWLSGFGLNFGIVILLLTIVVRVIITPLVFRNYKSSARMRVLKPEADAIAAKYPDRADAMKKQQEVMAMYRSAGVNPMAGCVPMLIQMPILFAMFRFIPSVFEIRQKSFLWSEDLSAYDSVANLGFEIPFYGEHVSLFTLLMAASTLAYTLVNSNQMTPQAGMPNMKFMLYLFPIMMIFFFNNYSSGLSYYYLLGNLMSMGIMFAIKKYFIDENKIRLALDENKKKPKKKSRFQERLEDMQRQQMQKRQQQSGGNNRQSRRKGS
jgi:YidC/Oxa1 family membrane protein insertase